METIEKHYLSYAAKEIDRRLKAVDDIPTKLSQLINDRGYITKEDIPEVEVPKDIATKDEVDKKQDKIEDLDAIRSGAAKGATAIQEIKTINGQSLEGKGNIVIEGSGEEVDLSGYVTKGEADKTYQPKGDYALKSEIPEVPTKVSELENDKEYITLEQVPKVDLSDYATKDEVKEKQDKLIEGDGISIEGNVISCIHDKTLYKVVTELPAIGEEHKIYLIVSTEQEENNLYNEWAYINGAWEMLGTYKATIDLEPYALKEDIPTKVSELENDLQYVTVNEVPESETYVLDFTIKDGINTGAYDAEEYAKLRAAIEAGKLIIIGGAVTRVTADSQAMAADYVVIRYGTPRISDDNTTVTMSIYELKFSATEYSSKAVHKVIK